MTTLSGVAAYVGRTVDLCAWHGAMPGGEKRLVGALALDGTGGAVVAGIQRLVQRFLCELLTVRGSMQYLPLRGCAFVADGKAGRWRTSLDVTQSFNSAMIDVRRNLLGEETTADPDDERFASATLLSATASAGTASVRILLRSRAGETYDFIAPLPITIL